MYAVVCRAMQVHADVCRRMRVHADARRCAQVQAGACRRMQLHPGASRGIQVHPVASGASFVPLQLGSGSSKLVALFRNESSRCKQLDSSICTNPNLILEHVNVNPQFHCSDQDEIELLKKWAAAASPTVSLMN